MHHEGAEVEQEEAEAVQINADEDEAQHRTSSKEEVWAEVARQVA